MRLLLISALCIATTAAAAEDPPAPTRAQVLSADICVRQEQRRDALEGIKAERRYSKIGGVVNLGLIWRMQATVRLCDEKITIARAEARQGGLRLLPCTDGLMRQVVRCSGIPSAPECTQMLDSILNELQRR